ncbi:TRAP transporter small permease, partial [Thermococci archaeon]
MDEKVEAEGYVAAVLLLIMILVAFVNVVTRYLFHASIAFTEEIEVAFFVWITFLGIG